MSSNFDYLLTGGLNDLPPQKKNSVRIFLSSTFSGNALENVSI